MRRDGVLRKPNQGGLFATEEHYVDEESALGRVGKVYSKRVDIYLVLLPSQSDLGIPVDQSGTCLQIRGLRKPLSLALSHHQKIIGELNCAIDSVECS